MDTRPADAGARIGSLRDEYYRVAEDLREGGDFTAGHYDEPNVLAHIRMNDRVDAEGRKVLFIEEIQSDWHQKGRDARVNEMKRLVKGGMSKEDAAKQVPVDFGYNTGERFTKKISGERVSASGGRAESASDAGQYWEFRDENGQFVTNVVGVDDYAEALTEAQRRTTGGNQPGSVAPDYRVPDAPFKNTWHELAMKRAIRHAAENGYDRVAWTTGEQQVNRYKESLRSAVDRIEWTKTDAGVHIKGSRGGSQVVDTVEKENAVSDAIGKSMADKIRDDPAQTGFFEGDDITIDATGMAAFYDRMLPQAANRIGKKFMAKTGKADVGGGGDAVHSFDINKALRKQVTEKGLPMFSVAPLGGAFPSGDSSPPEIFRLAPEQQKAYRRGDLT